MSQHSLNPMLCTTSVTRARRRRARYVIVLAVVGAPACLLGQSIPNITAPINAAHKAADATNERLAAQTGQALPTRRNTTAQPAPMSGPGSVPSLKSAAGVAPQTSVNVAAAASQPVTREIFTYESEARRDPFFSLILTEDLRPLLSDLKLVGILYVSSGRGSVAIMRDVLTNAQYRVNTGQTLGRMRVAQIKPRAVIFTIDEFGLSRQDSLFLVDSTKVRIR